MPKYTLDCLTSDGTYNPLTFKADTYEEAAEKAKALTGVVEVKGEYDPSVGKYKDYDFKDNMIRNAYPHVKNNGGKSIKIFS